MSFSPAPVNLEKMARMLQRLYKLLVAVRERLLRQVEHRESEQSTYFDTMPENYLAYFSNVEHELSWQEHLASLDYQDHTTHRAGTRIYERLSRVHPAVRRPVSESFDRVNGERRN
jgi:hypothetical protein